MLYLQDKLTAEKKHEVEKKENAATTDPAEWTMQRDVGIHALQVVEAQLNPRNPRATNRKGIVAGITTLNRSASISRNPKTAKLKGVATLYSRI